MNRVELKEKAKTSLKGKYGDAIKLSLIYFLIIFGIGFIIGFIDGFFSLDLSEETQNFINSLIELIIGGLLGFGMMSYYLKISRNEEVTYKELFSKTNLFWPYLAIYLLVAIFTTLWSLLFIIPGIIASISYSLVYLIKLDNPELTAMEVIKKSKNMMYGHKMEFLVLELSFLGWMILGIFTLGILYLWLVPYMNVTIANFYNKLKELENNK